MKKKQNKLVVFGRAVGILWKSSPKWMIFSLVLLNLLFGFVNGYQAKANQYFFDTISWTVQENGGFKQVLLAGVLIGGVALLVNIMNSAETTLGFAYHTYVAGPLTELVNLKCGRIDPIYYEDPKILDEIEKGTRGPQALTDAFRMLLSIVFGYAVNFIVMGLYLYQLEPALAVIPIVVFLPIAVTQLMRVGTYEKLENAITPIKRETQYYQDCMGSREYFKETRTLRAFGYFRHLLECAISVYNKEFWKADKKRTMIELVSKLMSLAGFLLALWLLVDAVWSGRISVGAFAAVFASLESMFRMLEDLILWDFGWVLQNLGNVWNFVYFMDLPEREGKDVIVTLKDGIEVKGVHFKYPSAEKEALSDINLSIRAGETLAIVGENGSGKSTLVKLLLGLYLPQEGGIFYDEQDISEISDRTLFDSTSAVFQDFQRYKLTIKDNIVISDLEYAAMHGGFTQEIMHLMDETTDDEVSVRATGHLKEMGLDCTEKNKYPAGLNTLLDREFGGIDLSGGQWQKVAIARGMFRNHKLIALDEPTAAIDPIEETRLYEQFMLISKGVTSLIVTHRLGSVRIADRIVVMDEGKIVQVGTHDELVTIPGKYSEMWEAQAVYYQNREGDVGNLQYNL